MARFVVIASLVVIAPARGMQVADRTAPATLLTWSHTDPLTFVALLTEAGVPAGLELRNADYERGLRSRSAWNPDELNANHFRGDDRVPLEQLVSAFNASHDAYGAEFHRDVILVRPTDLRAPYLDRRPFSGPISATGLMRVAEEVFTPLDPRLSLPGGRPGSRLSSVSVDYGDAATVRVPTADRLTVAETLNEVVRQTPGHAWIVLTSDPPSRRILTVGFGHRRRTYSWMHISADRQPAGAEHIERPVPAALLPLTRLPIAEFVRVLAPSVRSGIEIREDDDQNPRRVPTVPLTAGPNQWAPLSELVAAFNAAHTDYTAAMVGETFVIRPARERAPFLDGSSTRPVVGVTGIMQALRTIVSGVDPSLARPTVGAGMGSAALEGLSRSIILDGSNGRTVVETLNQIVWQFPGTWMITTRRGRIVSFSFIYSDSARTTARTVN